MSAQGRLMQEYQTLAKQTTPSVFARPDEDDVMHWTALIVGPPNTPYARGLFHFDMRFPRDYPNTPPKVLITTTSSANVRFNPNLYNNGKVCLSILGTWRAESSGEQWSAVQNVQSVLLSIQSLMHDKPYHNEPNFEADDGSGDIERYNDKIAHETLRVAVVEVMEDTLDARPTPNGAVASFADLRKQLFLMQHDNYVKTLERWAASAASHVRDGRQFKMMPFECSTNGMRGSFAWRNVGERLRALRKRVDEEMDGWRQIGVEQAALARSGSAIGLSPAVSTVREQLAKLHADPPELCFLGPGEENALVWEVSLLGPEGTSFEGGCFQLEILFPPNYPDSSPRIRFTTSIYHPNISPEGVPYLPTLLLWHAVAPRQRSAKQLLEEVRALLLRKPDPEPITHLNVDAAALCFSMDEESRKRYRREARRCAQRSNE